MENPQLRLGEDVVALIGGAQEWAKRTFGDLGEAYPHTGSECQWCPVCQFAALVRGERPEVAEKLVVAATAIADVFRALVAPAEAATGGATQDDQADEDEGPESHVQHISLAE